jgi:PPM family protein phosphatase
MKIEHAQGTHQGLVRNNNEDSIAVIGRPGDHGRGALFVVADGLGGMPGGEDASRHVVAALEILFDTQAAPTKTWLEHAFHAANESLYVLNQRKAAADAMATTLSACHFLGDHVSIGHVGDCRVYRLSDGVLQRLTTDHATSRQALTRVMGLRSTVDVDIHRHALRPKDTYLICSDGLHSEVDDAGIARALASPTAEEGCRHLMDQALANGGRDNVSLHVIRVA